MSEELRRVKRLEKLRANHQKCEKRMEDAAQTLLLMKANIEHSTGEHIKELSPDEPKDCSPSSPHQTLFSAGNHLPSPSSPTEDESELSSHSGSDEEYHPPAAASSSSSTEDELLTNELASQRVPEKHECDSSSKETEIIGAKSNKDSKQSGARSKKGTEQSHRLDEKKLSMNTKSAFKRPKKTAVKRKRDSDDCDEEDGEDRHRTATKSSVKNQKKTASQRPCSDDAVDVPISKPAKRPWTETEKNAVRRQMGKFMALRKVPGENDCRMCLEKESASLGARTWRDVKYFVYREIIKIKRKFQNR